MFFSNILLELPTKSTNQRLLQIHINVSNSTDHNSSICTSLFMHNLLPFQPTCHYAAKSIVRPPYGYLSVSLSVCLAVSLPIPCIPVLLKNLFSAYFHFSDSVRNSAQFSK